MQINMKIILSIIILLIVITQISFSQNIIERKVIEQKDPTSNKVIIRIMFKVGSVDDPVGKEGLTQLTADMMTSGGTSKYTYSQIQDLLYPMAAGYGSSVDKDVTTFYFQVPANFLEGYYSIVKDAILSPAFSESDFDRIKVI